MSFDFPFGRLFGVR